jgi:hypothetical protein
MLAKLEVEEVLLIGMHCSSKLQPKPYIIYTNCDNIQQGTCSNVEEDQG